MTTANVAGKLPADRPRSQEPGTNISYARILRVRWVRYFVMPSVVENRRIVRDVSTSLDMTNRNLHGARLADAPEISVIPSGSRGIPPRKLKGSMAANPSTVVRDDR